MALLIPAFVAGMRSISVGSDTSLYVVPMFEQSLHFDSFNDFRKMIKEGINVEFLYVVLVYWSSRITSNPNVYLFLSHVVMCGSFFFAFFKLKKNVILELCIFFFLFLFFRETLNTARQCFALGFCSIAFVYLIANKYPQTILFSFIAYGFHRTAIIFFLIVLLFSAAKKFWALMKTRKVKSILICSFFLALTSFASILQSLSFTGLIDERYEERYASAGLYGSNVPISLFALNTVNLIVFKLIQKKNNLQGPLPVFFEYILQLSLLSNFSGLISTFAVRMGNYFLYMSVIIFPYLYKHAQVSPRIKIFHMFFVVFYWFMTVIVANLGATMPYSSPYFFL